MLDTLTEWVSQHLEAAISLLALAVSLVSSIVFYLRQSAMTRRQTALQERITQIEEERREEERRSQQRADVTARFLRRQNRMAPFDPSYFVFLKNRGPAVAQDVTLTPESLDHQPPLEILDPQAVPLPSLDVGQEHPVQVRVIPGSPGIFDAVIGWTDGEGRQEKRVRSSWF